MKFNEIISKESEYCNTLLVDGTNLAFRYLHSNAETFTDKYIETVQSLARSYECSNIIICADKGSSTYRRGIYSEYKANRKAKYANQTPEEAAKIKAFFKELNSTLMVLSSRYPTIILPGIEADDTIAYICSKHKKGHLWIISTDKDLDQLITGNISRFSYVSRKEITIDNWSEHYAYPQENHLDVKCLMGDSGDNVPGVVGIGPVKAKDLIHTYGSIYDVCASLPIDSKYKYIQSLNAFGKDALLMNVMLMDLPDYCEEAIGVDNLKLIDEAII